MIIKCPECGHQISDKAPTCPSCGVVIAGNIMKCPDCGELYLKDEGVCPYCHRASGTDSFRSQEADEPVVNKSETNPQPSNVRKWDGVPATVVGRPVAVRDDEPKQPKEKPKKSTGKTALIVSIVIALLIAGVCFYMYQQAQNRHEQENLHFRRCRFLHCNDCQHWKCSIVQLVIL